MPPPSPCAVTFATKPFQHDRSVIHFVTIIISPAPNHTSKAVIYPPFKIFSNQCEGTGSTIHTDKESACEERVGKHNHEREVGGGLWQVQREEDGIDDQMRVLRVAM
jgi:hypothetical protein